MAGDVSGTMTTYEMAESQGYKLTNAQARQIGQILCGYLESKNELNFITKKKIKYKQENGKWQTNKTNAYPISLLPRFIDIYAAITN